MNNISKRVVLVHMIQYESYFNIICYYGNLNFFGVCFGKSKIHKKIGRKYLLSKLRSRFVAQDRIRCVNSIEEITSRIDTRICKIVGSYEVIL